MKTSAEHNPAEENKQDMRKSDLDTPFFSNIYICSECGRKWVLKDPTVTNSDLQFYNDGSLLKNGNGKTNRYKKGEDQINTDMVQKPMSMRICNGCRITRHRNATENPFLTQSQTGVMIPYIVENKHKTDEVSTLRTVTYTNFWLSVYCIRANCIRRATTYGFCQMCFNFCAERGLSGKNDGIFFDPQYTEVDLSEQIQ